MNRRVAGALLVLGATLAAGLGARGLPRAGVERVESFREKGPADAAVTIVEYSDFQCPACRAAEAPLKQLFALYGGKIRLIFKHFPLERMHPWARPAAVAAECAGRQGKFWEYHDALYERQADWTNDAAAKKFEDYARELKLDLGAFAACQKDAGPQAQIDADAKEGRDRWLGSTPTFFVNDKRFVGARQLQERGTPWIEKLLKR